MLLLMVLPQVTALETEDAATAMMHHHTNQALGNLAARKGFMNDVEKNALFANSEESTCVTSQWSAVTNDSLNGNQTRHPHSGHDWKYALGEHFRSTNMQLRLGHLLGCLKRYSLHALVGIAIAIAASARCKYPARMKFLKKLRNAAWQWRHYKCILMLMLLVMPTSSATRWYPSPASVEHESGESAINLRIDAKNAREYILQMEQLLDGFVQSQAPIAKAHVSAALHNSAEKFVEKVSRQQATSSRLFERNSPGPWSASTHQENHDALQAERGAAGNAAIDIPSRRAVGAQKDVDHGASQWQEHTPTNNFRKNSKLPRARLLREGTLTVRASGMRSDARNLRCSRVDALLHDLWEVANEENLKEGREFVREVEALVEKKLFAERQRVHAREQVPRFSCGCVSPGEDDAGMFSGTYGGERRFLRGSA